MNMNEFLRKIRTDKKSFIVTLCLLAGAIVIIAAAVIFIIILSAGSGEGASSGPGSGSHPENTASVTYTDEHFTALDTTKVKIKDQVIFAASNLKVSDLKTALNYQGDGDLIIRNSAGVSMGDDDLVLSGMTVAIVKDGVETAVYEIQVLNSSDIGNTQLPGEPGTSQAADTPSKNGSSFSPGSNTDSGSSKGDIQMTNPKEMYLGGHSVRDYGAKGDGKTDDTDAINAAVGHAMADGMPVYFPAGTYVVKRQISMTNGVTFYGKNVGNIKNEAASLPTILVSQESGPGLVFTAGGAISGIQVKYNSGHKSKQPALLCSSAGTRITNVVITNAYVGIEYAQANSQNPGRGCIENVIINNPLSVGAYIRETYDVAYVNNVTVKGSDAMASGGTAFRFGHNDAIRVMNLSASHANVGFLFDDLRVNGDVTGSTWGAFQNLSTSDVNIGVHIKSVSKEVRMNPLSFVNCTFSAGKEALKVEHCRASASFSNVTFSSGSASALSVDGGDALLLSRCQIKAKNAAGVHIKQTGNITINSCSITSSTVGVQLDNAPSRGIVIANNTISAAKKVDDRSPASANKVIQ